MKRIFFILALIGVATFFAVRTKQDNSEKVVVSPVQNTAPALTTIQVSPKQDAPIDPRDEALRGEAIQLTQSFIGILLERKNASELSKLNRENQNREDRQKIKDESRAIEMELMSLLGSSPAAREEFSKMVVQEYDPYVQRQLVGATRRLDSGYRTDLAVELTKSEDRESRKIGVDTLPRTGTEQAFTQLSQISNHDPDVEVQAAAVKSLSKFGLEKNGGQVPAFEVNQKLRDLTQSQSDPAIREAALRGLLSRGLNTVEDRELISSLAQNETDPRIRDLAISSQKALSARGN